MGERFRRGTGDSQCWFCRSSIEDMTRNVTIYECGHIFHRRCAHRAQYLDSACPICFPVDAKTSKIGSTNNTKGFPLDFGDSNRVARYLMSVRASRDNHVDNVDMTFGFGNNASSSNNSSGQDDDEEPDTYTGRIKLGGKRLVNSILGSGDPDAKLQSSAPGSSSGSVSSSSNAVGRFTREQLENLTTLIAQHRPSMKELWHCGVRPGHFLAQHTSVEVFINNGYNVHELYHDMHLSWDNLREMGLELYHLREKRTKFFVDVMVRDMGVTVKDFFDFEHVSAQTLAALQYSASELALIGFETSDLLQLGLNAYTLPKFKLRPHEWAGHLKMTPEQFQSLQISAEQIVAMGWQASELEREFEVHPTELLEHHHQQEQQDEQVYGGRDIRPYTTPYGSLDSGGSSTTKTVTRNGVTLQSYRSTKQRENSAK